MARSTSQWACIAILALMASAFTMAHAVKPPARTARSLALQMDTHVEPETTNFQASDLDGKATQPNHPLMDNIEASAGGHMVDPPARTARSLALQMDTHAEPKTTNFQASDSDGKATQPNHPLMDNIEASAVGCSGTRSSADRGIYGGGYGSGGTSFGLQNIFPFPGFPFGILVPQVSTWGDGGGYGGSDNNPGTGRGVSCQCAHSSFPMHYVITPVYFQPTRPASKNNMREDSPSDIALDPSHN